MSAQYDVAAPLPASSRLLYWLNRLLMPAVAIAAAVWIEAARFRLKTPSLIDEWFGVAYSGRALHALLHGHYLSAGSDFSGRYRPAYAAVWNYIQWHLLGEPSLTVANSWGILRTVALFIAIWLLAKLLLGPMRVPRPMLLLPPLAVLLTPQIAVALARFGPGEPMMVAGIVIGLTLAASGFRMLVDGARNGQRHRGAVAAIGGGYAVYLVGVYSKESSVALLAGVPCLLIWLWPSIRPHLLASRKARTVFAASTALLLAPPVHVASHLLLAALRGTSPWPNAHLSLGLKIYAAVLSPLLGVPGVLGTWMWFLGSLTAIAVVVALFKRKERDAWLLGGVLITGYLMSAIPLARGPMPTWYYIPWIVAVAAVAFRAVAYATPPMMLGVAALAAVLVPFNTPAALAEWTEIQQSGSTAINLSKGVVASGCSLYLSNFDIEQRVAIPLLFRFGRPARVARCSAGDHRAYAISWKAKPLPPPLSNHCASNWKRLQMVDNVSFYRCRDLRSFPVLDQNAASGEPTVTVARVRMGEPPPAAEIFQPLAAPAHSVP